MADLINKPPHYTHGRVEPIDAIESWQLGFHLGNVVKYLARAAHKGAFLDDLRKARWYLDRAIANEEAKLAPVRVVALKTAPQCIADSFPDAAEFVGSKEGRHAP